MLTEQINKNVTKECDAQSAATIECSVSGAQTTVICKQAKADLLFEIFSEEIPAKMQKLAVKSAEDVMRAVLQKYEVFGAHSATASAPEMRVYCATRRLAILICDVMPESMATTEEVRGPSVKANQNAIDGFLRTNRITKPDLFERNGYYFAKIEKPGQRIEEKLPGIFNAFIAAMPWAKMMHWSLHCGPGDGAVCDSAVSSATDSAVSAAASSAVSAAADSAVSAATDSAVSAAVSAAASSDGGRSFPWVRPVRSVVCMLDDKTIRFKVDGWRLETRNVTRGNRYFAGDAGDSAVVSGDSAGISGDSARVSGDFANITETIVPIPSAATYLQQLRANFVLADYTERKQAVLAEIARVLPEGLRLKEDEALLDEVTGLMDFPFAIVGDIPQQFMELPDFVLTTSMRTHQKYFAVQYCGEDSRLAPFFVAISSKPDPSGLIKKGFESVLRARLSDAAFFYKEDTKIPLENFADRLEHIVFHEKLGTMKQKVLRLRRLAGQSERAAELCKADLVTQMVGEFDELQGVVGAYYARKHGEQEGVAIAIRDHYKPAGQNDCLPAKEAIPLALADKVDSLIGFLGIGIKPSSSKDPFALRRLALGIIRIAELYPIAKRIDGRSLGAQTPSRTSGTAQAEHRSNEPTNFLRSGIYSANLMRLATEAVTVYQQQGIAIAAETTSLFQDFLYERLYFYALEQCGLRQDLVKSAIEGHKQRGAFLDVQEIFATIEALQEFAASDFFEDAMALFWRINGLVGKQKISDIKAMVDPELFEAAEEREVYNAIKNAEEKGGDEKGGAGLSQAAIDFAESCDNKIARKKEILCQIKKNADMRHVFDAFFQAIKVNAENARIAENRHALLLWGLALYRKIADFSQIYYGQ
jgi:glycyl-tRNA synthetase beta chain